MDISLNNPLIENKKIKDFVQFSPGLSQAWPKLADLVVFLTSLKCLVEFQRNSLLKFVMKQVPDDAGICKNKC
jgi:hypothetical protein